MVPTNIGNGRTNNLRTPTVICRYYSKLDRKVEAGAEVPAGSTEIWALDNPVFTAAPLSLNLSTSISAFPSYVLKKWVPNLHTYQWDMCFPRWLHLTGIQKYGRVGLLIPDFRFRCKFTDLVNLGMYWYRIRICIHIYITSDIRTQLPSGSSLTLWPRSN